MATIVNEEFAKVALAVKEVRAAARMNQQEFADALGVGKSAIQNWEYGRNQLSAENVRKICQTFNVPPSMFGEEYASLLNGDPALKAIGGLKISAIDLKNVDGLAPQRVVSRDFLSQAIPGFKDEMAVNLGFYRVHGMEMAPMVQPQDLLLVDVSHSAVTGADLYIIEKGGWSFLRLCYLTLDGTIVMKTQSDAFRDSVEVPAQKMEELGFKVVGKVISTKLNEGIE